METSTLILIALLIAPFILLAATTKRNQGSQAAISSPAEDSDDEGPAVTPPPRWRVDFSSGTSTLIRGWPSKGGLYVLNAYSGVELDFLHLDRFIATRSSANQDEEDAHCDNMRKLGATWWESEYDFEMKRVFEGSTSSERVLVVGWPSGGGVWVFNATRSHAMRRGIGKLANAYNMEERCRVIKDLRGAFYANPGNCPDLSLEAE